VSAYRFQTHEADLPQVNTFLQDKSTTRELLLIKGDENGTQDHLVDYEISVINRNHCNQSDIQHAQAILQSENHDKDCTVANNNTSPEKARVSRVSHSKKRCPHHPYARWVRFDPSGQAWRDKLDCWDCYMLMKIDEALDYRPLSKYTRGIVTVQYFIMID
jgi:hypothetical protein